LWDSSFEVEYLLDILLGIIGENWVPLYGPIEETPPRIFMHLYRLGPMVYAPDYCTFFHYALVVSSGSGSSGLRHCETERAGEGVALDAMPMAKGVRIYCFNRHYDLNGGQSSRRGSGRSFDPLNATGRAALHFGHVIPPMS
jgi:hypothetical protein